MIMQLLRRYRGLAGSSALLAMLIAAPMLSASTAYAESATAPVTLSIAQLDSDDAALRVLTPAQAQQYRTVFAALREQRWADAANLINADQNGPLHDIAQAELFLAKNSPKAELQPLLELIARAPHLVEADPLTRLARTRGASTLPALPQPQKLSWVGGAPKREKLDSGLALDPIAAKLQPQVMQFVKSDLPGEAEALVEAEAANISPNALAELRYIIAWSWYGRGNDDTARAVASRATSGSGNWAVQANWIVGLIAWRQQDCNAAANAFANVAEGVTDRDLRAAGQFWAARSEMACGRPQTVQARMRRAAAERESFYGMLAAQYLGMERREESAMPAGSRIEREIITLPNIRVAMALADVGELELADKLIRHQARIGDPSQHLALINLAVRLNLPNTQLWLAQNAPAGVRTGLAARYPLPDWNPANGWRVDRALLMAHSLQESNFRPQVVSPAGAQGLMQVMPGTAALIARGRGETIDIQTLRRPSINLEYGQLYLEKLRDQDTAGGLLPKVIAAYNAGPGAVARWNEQVAHDGDPLLYIESIPYWETRNYVMIVLRNYWMYQRLENKPTTSLAAISQGMWPRFPGMTGKTAMRMSAGNRRILNAD